ncbi:MAG: A/G-specific adenine glycosylase [Halodesulfurarchaeum sp.]
MASVGSLEETALPAVRSALLEWFAENQRSFPWRESEDPYEILVSEVMSQQTQLDRIVEPWRTFVERWPSPAALASADRAAVISFWTDHRLGYNNRARYLHEASERIVEEFGGELPADPAALRTLPGVGPYTSTAVAAFAFEIPGAVVDTNVKRVLYRAFDVPDDRAAFESAAEGLLRRNAVADWNNAIMELGALVCGRTPACEAAACPWKRWCQAYRTGDFTAPDVPSQPAFDGSRRQKRGRVLRALSEHGTLSIDALGVRVRVDFEPGEEGDREWLEALLADLETDGLVTVTEGSPRTVSLAD